MTFQNIIALQKKRMNLYTYGSAGDSVNDESFDEFEENPAFRIVKFKGEDIKVHLIDDNIKAGIVQRYVIPKPPFKFNVGDMYTDEKDINWLCWILNDFHYNKCLVLPCNDILTYQDPTTLEIITIPCVLTDKSSVYNDGLKTGVITLQDDQIAIKVPFHPQIAEFNIGKRLIFQHRTVYELTQINDLTEKGLITLTMKRSQESKVNDRKDLNIADYIEPTIDPDPPKPTEIVVVGSNTIKLNQTSIYTVDSVDSILFYLKSDDGLGDSNLAQIIEQGSNTCKVKVSGNSSDVNKYFRLYASDGINENYIRIMIRSLF